MQDVVERGTAAGSRVPGIAILGKTGTAQNPHGKDHSLFVAFAPRENPRIAIGLMVENGGWGASWAAPIGTLMIEKYLNDTVKRTDLEKRMFEGVVYPPHYRKDAGLDDEKKKDTVTIKSAALKEKRKEKENEKGKIKEKEKVSSSAVMSKTSNISNKNESGKKSKNTNKKQDDKTNKEDKSTTPKEKTESKVEQASPKKKDKEKDKKEKDKKSSTSNSKPKKDTLK
jgi:penicillin-binding protein 2